MFPFYTFFPKYRFQILLLILLFLLQFYMILFLFDRFLIFFILLEVLHLNSPPFFPSSGLFRRPIHLRQSHWFVLRLILSSLFRVSLIAFLHASYFSTLKRDVTEFLKICIPIYKTARPHIPENNSLNSHCRGNLKSPVIKEPVAVMWNRTGWRRLIPGRSSVPISAGTSAILTYVCCCFTQSLQANPGTVPR